MLSDLLGLTIDKGNLNKKSPSPVTSSLKKTATNYLAIGRMAEDLKLIRLNFSRWLAIEGVKVRGTPDMHMLKEDELSKKFGVMREKYFRSKVKLASSDGTSSNKGWAKNLLEKYVGYKIGRKIERNLAAAVLKKYKKLTWIRKLVRLKKKIKVFVNKILSKINLKKMLGEWINQNYKKFVEPLAKHLASKLGFTTGLKAGLKGAATVALKGFVRVIPFIGWAIVIFEGLYAAWNSPPNSDIFKEFILGALDSLTLGLVGKENISAIYDKISEWHSTLFAKMFDAIDRSFKFIEEKMTSFVDFIIEKGKSLFTVETRPADFESSFEKWNKQRLQEESKMFEEYSDYFDKMEKAISDKKIKIGKLQFEIASLEYSISAMVKGPEDARLQEAKIQKAKEEAEKTRLEEEVKKTREGGGPVEEKKKKSETPTSTKPSAAPVTPPPTKPSAAPVTPPSTKPSTVTPTSSGAGGTEQAILDEIAKHESESSGGYNAMNQGTKGKIVSGPSEKIIGKKLTDMTVGELMEKAANDNDSAEKRKKEGLIFAAGRYQIIPKTLKELVKKGAASVQDKFDAKTQDKLCIALLELRGLSKYKQGKISAKEFQNNLAKEWASLPTTEGVSYYHKPGQNVAGKGADQGLKNAIATITPATDTKLASAEPKPTTTASSGKFLKDESKQVAQAQREQMKPKDVNVAKVDKTNNVKQTNYQNVAMGKDTNPAETVTNRAA